MQKNINKGVSHCKENLFINRLTYQKRDLKRPFGQSKVGSETVLIVQQPLYCHVSETI